MGVQLALRVIALVTLVAFGPAIAGPSCTIRHPRGFHVAKGTKKHPLNLCTGGDIQATWDNCTSRYKI